MKSIKEIANVLGVQPASIRRKIKRYRASKPNLFEDIPEDWNPHIEDTLPNFIIEWLSGPKPINNNSKDKPIRKVKTIKLKDKLSADWLVIMVLGVMLLADAMAFGLITHNAIGAKVAFAGIIFGFLGFSVGVGGAITFARIKESQKAEVWKWVFAAFQVGAFYCAINEHWFIGKIVITIMTGVVFAGVVTSVRE